ncbi:BCCT family transporter [Stieleria sp.]|uniref:BCCT family transporter n=1 Tax=Stieleria sp. TaxID=2795976 RepID=UPI003567DB9D
MSHTTTTQRPTTPRAEQMPRVVIGPHCEMHPVVLLRSAAIVLAVALLCFVWPANELQDAFVAVGKAISEGLVATALLDGGGLDALQAASIAAAHPLTFVLLLACYGRVTSLHRDSQISSSPLSS